jgi:hypothetical protein
LWIRFFGFSNAIFGGEQQYFWWLQFRLSTTSPHFGKATLGLHSGLSVSILPLLYSIAFGGFYPSVNDVILGIHPNKFFKINQVKNSAFKLLFF